MYLKLTSLSQDPPCICYFSLFVCFLIGTAFWFVFGLYTAISMAWLCVILFLKKKALPNISNWFQTSLHGQYCYKEQFYFSSFSLFRGMYCTYWFCCICMITLVYLFTSFKLTSSAVSHSTYVEHFCVCIKSAIKILCLMLFFFLY